MTSADRVAVVGTGLIGTSVAMAAGRVGDAVRGFDTDADALARPSGAADAVRHAGGVRRRRHGGRREHPDPGRARRGGGGAPIGAGRGRDRCGEREVARRVRARGVAGAGDLSRYVGGHPMGGSERSGPDHASASVLDGIVGARRRRRRARALERVEAFVAKIGARPVRLDAERHDRLVAMVSHLPQVASTALMGVARPRRRASPSCCCSPAAGSATSRGLAASSPHLWSDILVANGDAIGARSACTWSGSRGSARWSRPATPARSSGRSARRRTRGSSLRGQAAGEAGVAVLQVLVPDRPGVLAEVTAAMSQPA